MKKSMKKTRKRIFSTLLVMALVFTLLPVSPAVLVAGAAEAAAIAENPPENEGGIILI
ncbi:MAG: hypothetical protein LBI54_06270 [Lachnospiraceae bacterium]|jgi:hypothetical protein|nr:hypothetical protein [Lachnospiraceae bacterium]